MSNRKKQSLSGYWSFWKDSQAQFVPDKLPEEGKYSVQVPAPWQTQADDLRDYTGVGWYRRNFQVQAGWLERRRLVVMFGAVDYLSEVWINGQLAGEHEGGYLPFEMDITELVSPGSNTLVVKVEDALEYFAEVPHGKQSWYGPISGIWQDVWIESRPERFIRRVRITPQGEQVQVETTLNGTLQPGEQLTYDVQDPDGQVIASGQAEVENFTIEVAAPQVWSPDTPALYTLRLALSADGSQDTIEEIFGFRTIETQNGMIMLNGQPLYLRGALDQDYYPELVYTPPSAEYIEAQLRQAKELGLNCMRVHIKIADPRYYTAADRAGILIWTELPNWKDLTEAARRRAKETLEGMLERDWNHPSIIIWTIINENWGTDLTHNAAHREWVRDTYHDLKDRDPLRLVVDNSACYANYHVITDLEDYHNYYAQPDHYTRWRDWVASLASRPAWTFVPELEDFEVWSMVLQDHWSNNPRRHAIEVMRRREEPLLVSEFGNWGLPDVEKLRACYGGKDPWWFETGYDWGDGVVYPHGVDQRFRDYHLARAFNDLRSLSEASQELQFQAMKYEIEQMRRHPSIQGYVITEFTDLHWECNGLLDMCRNPKVYYDRFHTINADTILIPEWERLAYAPGETCRMALVLAHHASSSLAGSRLEWKLDNFPGTGGVFNLQEIQPYGVSEVGLIQFTVPEVTSSQRARLSFALLDTNGRRVAENTQDIAIVPITHPDPAIKIYSPDLSDRLKEAGYTLVESMPEAQLVVMAQLTQPIYRFMQAGGKAIWLAEDESTTMGLNTWKIQRRHRTHWQGDWASSFSWIAGDGPFKSLPTYGAVDFLFAGITPDHVICEVKPEEFATSVHAGIFVGWLRQNAALVGERRIGEGQLMISTFQLSANMKTNPLAAVMFQDMVAHMTA